VFIGAAASVVVFTTRASGLRAGAEIALAPAVL